MNTKEAVSERIMELCNEHDVALNSLATISGLTPSTVYGIVNDHSKNPGIVTIKKLCDGLNITLRQFFNSPIFEDIEQEIK